MGEEKLYFDELVDRLYHRLRQPLPGRRAHEPMRALPTGNLLPRFEHKVPPRPGSVLLLLYPGDSGVIQFPLIKRTDYLGTHSGQISFPGGKAEQGENPVQTALREAEEEIGVQPSSIQILGQLSNFFVIPSNFMVTPVVGVVDHTPVFVPDPGEVDKILCAGLQRILPDESIKTSDILAAGKFTMRAPHFEVEGEVVWGATAMMLNEFRWVINEIINAKK